MNLLREQATNPAPKNTTTLRNPKLDEVAKAGARIEIESCKEELKKIQNGEVKDEEI